MILDDFYIMFSVFKSSNKTVIVQIDQLYVKNYISVIYQMFQTLSGNIIVNIESRDEKINLD